VARKKLAEAMEANETLIFKEFERRGCGARARHYDDFAGQITLSTVATCPPNRKAEGQRRLLGDMRRRGEIARSDAALLKAWLEGRVV
jgi:hypothetical protein